MMATRTQLVLVPPPRAAVTVAETRPPP
jgi:hypothetical protein